MIAWVYHKIAQLFRPKITFTPDFDLDPPEEDE